MKLAEAVEALDSYVGREFSSFLTSEQLLDLRTNKGDVGQLLERLIGLRNSSKPQDFEDGELKTNKVDPRGFPKETMFITMVGARIDSFIRKVPFETTPIYNKVSNFLYVPVCKEGPEENWMFLSYIHVNLALPEFRKVREQLNRDYITICDQLRRHIEQSPDHFIHTSNGQFIQVRSKDSKPYHPIYSESYGRNVSNKNHAFYFKKAFMLYLLETHGNLSEKVG